MGSAWCQARTRATHMGCRDEVAFWGSTGVEVVSAAVIRMVTAQGGGPILGPMATAIRWEWGMQPSPVPVGRRQLPSSQVCSGSE